MILGVKKRLIISYLLMFILLLLCLVGCKETAEMKENSDRIFIDLNQNENKTSATLFDNLELIPLELTQESAIKLPSKIIEYNGSFYILDRSTLSILKFTKEGKYQQTITHIGYGPYEYSLLEDMYINPFTGHLEMLDPTGKIVVYDLENNVFVEEYKLPFHEELRSAQKIIPLNKDTILLHSSYSKHQLHWYSKSKEKFIYYDFPRRLHLGMSIMNTFRKSDGNVYFINIDDNSIYEIIGTRYEVFQEYNFGDHDINRIIQLADSKNGTFKKMLEEEGENIVEEYSLAYPLSNYFFNINTVQFMYNNSAWLYHPDNLILFSISNSFDGVPLGWEQDEHIYGMIFHADNYRKSIDQKFLTQDNIEILDNWEEGDNIILMKFTANNSR